MDDQQKRDFVSSLQKALEKHAGFLKIVADEVRTLNEGEFSVFFRFRKNEADGINREVFALCDFEEGYVQIGYNAWIDKPNGDRLLKQLTIPAMIANAFVMPDDFDATLVDLMVLFSISSAYLTEVKDLKKV